MSGYLDRSPPDYLDLPDRVQLSRLRVALAFVLTPLLAAIAFAAVEPGYEGLPNYAERVFKSALLYAMFGALPATIVLGIPAYLFLRKVLRPTLFNCAVAGAFVAALPWFLIGVSSQPDYASTDGKATVINGSMTAYGWLELGQVLLIIGGAGAVGGTIFWLIAAAKWPRRRTS